MDSKAIKKIEIATEVGLTLGAYTVILASGGTPWVVGLSAFISLLSGTKDIGNVIFQDIDIELLKNKVESSPENGKLFWSIIDSGLKETSHEKVRIYNSYLQEAIQDEETAKSYNSKVLLVIQQILYSEYSLFLKTYENQHYLQIINLISSVQKDYFNSNKKLTKKEIDNWFEKHIKTASNGLAKQDYLRKINFKDRPFTQLDLKRMKMFQKFSTANELDMLAFYGLLQPGYGAIGGTTYRNTEFGKYFYKFAAIQ